MTALVVGAGDGLGLAVARRFGREGHPVVIVARKAEPLAARAEALTAEGIPTVAIAADLADPDAPHRIVDEARAAVGPIDVLVYNCAALGRELVPSALDRASLLRSLEVNLLGALATAQTVLPCETILFTGGAWALEPSAPHAALSLAKAAQRNLSFSLAQELGPKGIHVTTVTITGAIEPGTVHDPARLAGEYWRIHCQPPDEWTPEVVC